MKKHKQFIDLENDRYGLFFNQRSVDLDIEYGREFLRKDNPQYVMLYKMNVLESKSHPLYGQSKPKDKKYMKPVRISCMVNIEDSKQELYGGTGGMTRDDSGNIVLTVYLKELEEKNIEVNRGDIILYNFSGEKNRFYEVENANNVSDTTSNSFGGMYIYYKKITGVPVKEDFTNLLNDTVDSFV